MAKSLKAALGFVPSGFAGLFEKDLVERAAIAIFQGSGDFCDLKRLSRQTCDNEGANHFFRVETDIELGLLKFARELRAKAFGFGEHSNQTTLDGFSGTADQLRPSLNFAAPF